MAKKYYAVQKGRHRGIFETWAACEKEVKGVGGAIYKSFSSKAEAEAFLEKDGYDKARHKNDRKGKVAKEPRKNPSKESPTPIRDPHDTCDLFAYIDGSYESSTGVVGYGGIIVHGSKEVPFSFGTKERKYSQYWNVAGELLAARYVMEYALNENVASCSIYYDYKGIEMWATKRWKANNPLTKEYTLFAEQVLQRVHVHFYKVAAHTGVAYNEWADALAKEGTLKG